MDNLTISTQYWVHAIASGSALRDFYETNNYEDYTRFVQSCQSWADLKDIPFVQASNQIHAMFNINPGAKYANA
jgi:hypothetical protein